MATAPCPPHSTVQSAITSNSWKSCRPALPVRGSSRPSQQAMNRSKPSSHAIRLLRRKVESISPEPGKPSLECQGDSKCESPERRFTVGRMAEHYLAIYNQLLNGGRDSCWRPTNISMHGRKRASEQ